MLPSCLSLSRDEKAFSRSSALLILIALTFTAVAFGYWSGLLDHDERFENLEIVELTSARVAGDLVLNLVIGNNGTADAKLEYIVVNGSVISNEGCIIPYGSQIKIEIQLGPSYAPNSHLVIRLHTASGKDFEQTITIPESPEPRFEKIEIPTAYANKVSSWTAINDPSGWTEPGWNITLVLKNSGLADATIDNVFVNGKPYTQFSISLRYGGSLVTGTLSVTVNAGGEATIEILIQRGTDQGITFSSGTALDIKLHSAAGKEYPKLIDLT